MKIRSFIIWQSSLVAVIILAGIAFAETKTFIKEYTYQASEYDSKVTSRTLALEQVKRLLLEELGTYLESNTEVRNYQLSKDQITTFTAGIVSTEVIDEKWDGKTYYLKSKISADPNEVAKSIDSLRQDKQKSKELEDLRKKSDGLASEVDRLRKELESKSGQVEPKQYTETVNKLSAMDWIGKAFKLMGDGKNPEKNKEALTAVNKAIELSPEWSDAYFIRAMIRHYFKVDRNLDEIISDIDKAIQYYSSGKEKSFYSSNAIKYSIRAKIYKEKGNYQQAMKDLEVAIKLDPSDVIDSGGIDPEKQPEFSGMWSKSDFDEIIKRYPKDYRGYLFRGVYYDFFTKFQFTKKESYEKSIKDYKRAISLNPQSALVHYLLGNVYYKRSLFLFPKDMKDYGRATEALTKAIRLNHEYGEAYKLRAAVHLDKAQYKSSIWVFKTPASELKYDPQDEYRLAIKDFDKAVRLDPNDAGLYHDRAIAHKELGEYDNAVRDLTKAIGMKHDSYDWPRSAYEIRAHVYEAMEKYGDAINDYTKAFEIWEKKFGEYHKEYKIGSSVAGGILEGRAAAYRKIGNPKQAVIDYLAIIDWAGDNPIPMTYEELGDTYIELKQPENALKAYDNAIEVNAKKDYGPSQGKSDTLASQYFVKKAKVYIDLKKYDLAVESYNKALDAIDDLPPYKGELYKEMGMLYKSLGINQEAIKTLSMAVQYLPLAGEDPFMVYFDLGSIYSEMGDHNEAIRITTEMISLRPTFHGTYVMRGEEYVLINEYHKAIDDFSKAIGLQPTNEVAYYDRGYSLIKIGKYKQGLDDIKIAARLGHKQAQELLAKQGVDW